jgi:hypothetical protein
MRDAEEIRVRFGKWRRTAEAERKTDQAEHIPATGATRSIGSKLSLQRSTKFREEMGNGSAFPDYPERRPQTQNKKRKSHYEKSKHSVQTKCRTSDPAAPRLPCGSAFLGTQYRVSPRPGAV